MLNRRKELMHWQRTGKHCQYGQHSVCKSMNL